MVCESIGTSWVFKLVARRVNFPSSHPAHQTSAMPSCHKQFFAAKLIISRLRKLFRRPCQNERAAQAPDKNLIAVVDGGHPQTAEHTPPPPNPTANEDDVRRDRPLLPPDCRILRSGDINVLGGHPARGGAFADVWDGSLAGSRVVIKSYRTYSAIDSTQARMVRVHQYLQAFSFTDLPSATETL